jgi:hypothetical protein
MAILFLLGCALDHFASALHVLAQAGDRVAPREKNHHGGNCDKQAVHGVSLGSILGFENTDTSGFSRDG